MKTLRLTALALLLSFQVFAQESSDESQMDFTPQIHGSIRGKYEYQPEIDESRFQVRNARLNVSGFALENVYYKAEIDLSDQGVIRMLDAYVRLYAMKDLSFSIGQMRVPFTIDAHRSPYARYFANRSFIGKQVGDIRDVGAVVAYTHERGAVPYILEGGVYNGDGLLEQKEWQSNLNSSLKAQMWFGNNWNLTLSHQRLQPAEVIVNMYDAGANFSTDRMHIEFEYLYKTYSQNAFDDVYSINAFAMYNFPLKRGFFKNISILGRYDMMTDHSDGEMDDDEIAAGKLNIDDAARDRLTGGITFSLDKMFVADIRLNYEKYFYHSSAAINQSELDKIVIEFVCKF
ncbi:MAG: porin [Rikenellaceae bacterium]